MQFFKRAVDGSRLRVPKDLEEYLPSILWMFQMGLILFWINDTSAGQKKTRALLEKSVDVVTRLIRLASLPLTKPIRKMVTDLVDTVSGT